MKNFYKIIVLLFILTSITNCTKKDAISTELEVQNFVWKGLNAYYLWQDDVNDLQDTRFTNQNELNNFVSAKTAYNLFESLLLKTDASGNDLDKWSWIVNDYVALEQSFAGSYKSNGMRLGRVILNEGLSANFLYVRYVIPNSEASSLGIQRGDIIYAINGQQLTQDNYRSLLATNTYTANFGTLTIGSPNTITPTDNNIVLNKEQLDINPIHTVKIHEVDGKKIGYILYNQFVSNYDSQLNEVFSQFKNEPITDLVLDLRYNPGGSVRTAVNLASMITGQFTNQLFAKEKWNTKWQSYYEATHPEYLINNFTDKLANGETINSLNFGTVTIIVSGSSASASELVINGLKPHMNVNLIGTKTHGKYVGSVTLYDSNSYRRDDSSLNSNHHYAMQPIVLEMVNKLGNNNKGGFIPEDILGENFANLGELGNPNEPLFELAINKILGLRRNAVSKTTMPLTEKENINIDQPFFSGMHVELK